MPNQTSTKVSLEKRIITALGIGYFTGAITLFGLAARETNIPISNALVIAGISAGTAAAWTNTDPEKYSRLLNGFVWANTVLVVFYFAYLVLG